MLRKELWFHEDDYARVQFLPFSCWNFCCDQLDKLGAHDVAHRAPEGVGWTKMYSLPAAPAPTASLAISTGDLAAAMPWKLRRTNRVLTGTWSEKGERLPRTAAYRSGSCAIVFGWNEDRIVESLWFKDGYASWWNRRALIEAFFRLGLLAPLLLVDWRGALIDLRDRKAIRAYVRSLGGRRGSRDDDAKSGTIENETPAPAEAPPPPRPDSLHRFECPVRPALVTRKIADAPMRAILTATDGRSWEIDLDDDSLSENSPVVPRPMNLGGDNAGIDWLDLANSKVMTLRDDSNRERFEVCDIRDGKILYSVLDVAAAVLSPNGQHLLLFEDDGIAVADLRKPACPIRQSGLFPIGQPGVDDDPSRLDISLDNPNSVMAVAAANGDGFTLAVGDYGFAAVAVVRLGGAEEPPLIVTEAARVLSEGLVYDPVDIVDIIPGEALLVRHGYGTGIARFDLRTGVAAHCPLPDERAESCYGTFRSAVASSGSPAVWVQTDFGPHVWDETGSLKRAPDEACSVLATDGDRYLGLSPDGWDLVRGRFWPELDAS